MADMTVLDYAMMVEDSHVETRIIEYRKRGPTAASPAAARNCWRWR
jgi:arginyl-tRNA--protein-N-Asp/Glu arginylyltransferase